MTRVSRWRLLACFLAATASIGMSGVCRAARPVLAVFMPEYLSAPGGGTADNALSVPMATVAQTFRDIFQDRFDVRLVTGEGYADEGRKTAKARSLGASYVLTSTISRIGRTITLDGTIGPVEEPDKGRTVVVTGADDSPPGGPPVGTIYRRLAIQAASRLKTVFVGDELAGEGAGSRKVPRPSGVVTKSRNVPGEVISIAKLDTDRDGKSEVVAAHADAIVVYRTDGNDLVEKARIPGAGPGIVHVDSADLDRNGIAEIISTRFSAGQALSDIYEFDGSAYRKKAGNIPFFLRTADLGTEGIVLLAQASDAATIHAGPVFRMSLNRYGLGERPDAGGSLPLPEGTWIYGFSPVAYGKRHRYAAVNDRGRVVLLDENGKALWESMDAVGGTETVVEAADGGAGDAGKSGRRGGARNVLPARILPVDLDGDKTDEIVLMNNVMAAGVFFENVRLYSSAEALCFVQEETTLRLAWRSVQIDGPARDAFADFDPVSKRFSLGVAGQDPGRILAKSAEWRLVWLR